MEKKEYHFPGQKPDEKVLLFLRRHWLSFLPSCLAVFIMILISAIVPLLLRNVIDFSEYQSLVIVGISAFLLFALAFFITAFVDYYLDICIVTGERIIDIEQHGLFHRVISEQNLIRVQDVTAKKEGIFQTFFDFGDVFIQTAGEAPNFEFLAIPKPNETAQTILKLHHEIMAKGYQEPEEKPPASPSQGGPILPEPPETPKPPESEEAAEKELKEIPKIEE